MSDLTARVAALPPEKRALLERKLRQKREAESGCIVAQPRRGQPFPLSFQQERMWFIHRWDPESPLYNDRLLVCMTGHLDVEALECSVNEIVRRHESLRTTFRLIDQRPMQIVSPALTVTLQVEDLRQLPEMERESEFHQRVLKEIKRPFDLECGPLLRARHFRLSDIETVLLLTMHHIAFDGWSFGILVEELAMTYGALSTQNPVPLPELPVQYADFAVWQREWLQGERLSTLLDYWKQQLTGVPDVLNLPCDRPRPAVQSSHGARLPLKLDRSLCDDLKALSRREGITFFMTLLTAFATMLYRLTGQEDIVIGTPVANRGQMEVERIVGVFMNTLVLRIDLSGDPSFRELAQRVRQVTLDAYAHQALPFASLVAELQLKRSLSHTPLFQVSFGFQNAPLQSVIEMPDLTMDVLEIRSLRRKGELPPIDNGMAMFDLTFHLLEIPEDVAGWVEYKTELFDRNTIARIARHYKTLLRSIIANPDQRVSALPLLTKEEHQQILVEWNATRSSYPAESCIHTLFEEQVSQAPGATAVTFEDQALTYAELNRKANQLAHHLRSMGVGPEALVGMCVERSLEMIVAILGVLKAGAAFVPLDPTYPRERLASMLMDAQPPVLLTQHHLAEGLPRDGVRVICLDSDWETIGQESEENPVSGVTASNLAYVIYTSGSTGQPKGVSVPHRGLCNVAEAQIQTFDVQSGDRVIQFSSLSFDASVFEIVMALRAGATLCLARRELLLPGPPLLQTLRGLAITNITIPPSSLMGLPTEELPGLQTIAVAGEACPADLVARWAGGRRFFNLYGPTETTIWATATECVDDGRNPHIGRPIGNAQIYVLDGNMKPVPIGVPGELVVGGVGVARGYLNRPGLTAERFVPDPFSGRAGARLYRTGDLVRYLLSGNVEFLGRLDQQVKVRGFRIELGEIEVVLGQHPQVREAVVLAREDKPGDKRLVAYVVSDEERTLAIDTLRAFLEERLPDYMVPSAFVVLDALPLTPNGKVDRSALPAPEGARPQLQAAYVEPQTELERTIAGIWRKVLDVDKVGVDDNFFDLGGHSLLVVKVHSELYQAIGRDLPIVDMFKYPTIRFLAQHLGQEEGESPSYQKTRERAEEQRKAMRRQKQRLKKRQVAR